MTNYFSKNLKYLRQKRKLQQQELAAELNIPKSTLSCWEAGIRTPNIEQIQKIAKYFDVDMEIISKDYSNLNFKTHNIILENEEFEILKIIFREKGILKENDNISKEDFEKYLDFTKRNKDFFIKKNDNSN